MSGSKGLHSGLDSLWQLQNLSLLPKLKFPCSDFLSHDLAVVGWILVCWCSHNAILFPSTCHGFCFLYCSCPFHARRSSHWAAFMLSAFWYLVQAIMIQVTLFQYPDGFQSSMSTNFSSTTTLILMLSNTIDCSLIHQAVSGEKHCIKRIIKSNLTTLYIYRHILTHIHIHVYTWTLRRVKLAPLL